MVIPNYVGKSADEIIAVGHFDSAGYLFKSMAWLDCYARVRNFSPLLYACTDARHGIEYLLFEELVISTGAELSEAEYKKCVNERNRFVKTIASLAPDYDRLKTFTKLVVATEQTAPRLINWDHKALLRAWGKTSHYLHWFGAEMLTTQRLDWLDDAYIEIHKTVEPIWKNMISGQSGIMLSKDMSPPTKELWDKFKNGLIGEEDVKVLLEDAQQQEED